MTEFTGLDLEMSIESHYDEVIDMVDHTLLSVFRGLQEKYRAEVDYSHPYLTRSSIDIHYLQIEIVKLQHPHEDLVFLDKTLRLKYSEGIKMLKESGWKDDDGSGPSEWEDLSTRAEQRLGQLVKEKYHTDYYILGELTGTHQPPYVRF